ncbi:hypothetical protein [Pseudomonas profundi]|uniref:hypothetical protein n=1 Tax=Pseudomonas profundi TaxID=1981513 RepID=UPI001238DEB8|nr:hypothetical protein [Pseudomonas profundi]
MMNLDNWGPHPVDLENNQPAELGFDMAPSVYKNTNWIVAIDAWDHCDSSILEEMLKRHPLPFELQPVIAGIVSGARKQRRKAAAKLRVPAGHRMFVAGLYAELKRSVIDTTLKRKSCNDYHDVADAKGIEVAEYRKELLRYAADFKNEWAENAGISVETLDNMVDEIKLKIKNYPKI